VESLSLDHAETAAINQGNLVGLMGSFQTEDGITHELADIWFKTETLKNAYIASEVNPSELIEIMRSANIAIEDLVMECNPEVLSDTVGVDVTFVSTETINSYDIHVTDNSKPIVLDQLRPLI
jgi:hypothetical protein